MEQGERTGMMIMIAIKMMIYNDNDYRNDQNLEMLMIYDNSRQVWTQVRLGDFVMKNFEES